MAPPPLPCRLAALVLLVLVWGCEEEPVDDDALVLTVDPATTTGEIRGLHDGVNAGPWSYAWELDLSPVCDEVGLRWFRTHDLAGGETPSAGDIRQIYGNTDEGDVEDPASYDFSMIDPMVTTAVEGGREVFYRLGDSWGYPGLPGDTSAERWAEVADRIIRHFNEGWPDGEGHEYGIRYWEIFNEPEHENFFAGTQQQWFDFFETVYTILDERHPDLEIGCCGFARYAPEASWRGPFLDHCDGLGIDPDFVSWHAYDSVDPTVFAAEAQQWRAEMDAFGMTGESILSEWGMFSAQSDERNANAEGAAFYASALIALQDADVDLALRYRLDGLPDTFVDDYGFSMVNPDGTAKIPTLSFQAFEWLRERTPVRVGAEGAEAAEVDVIAGRSEDGEEVQALVSAGADAEGTLRLELDALPWEGGAYTYELYRLDDDHRLEQVDTGTGDGEAFSLELEVVGPQVQLVRIGAGS